MSSITKMKCWISVISIIFDGDGWQQLLFIPVACINIIAT